MAWDHTRSPLWNLHHVVGMSTRELVSGTTALAVLLAAFGVSATRGDDTAPPVIVSFPEQAADQGAGDGTADSSSTATGGTVDGQAAGATTSSAATTTGTTTDAAADASGDATAADPDDAPAGDGPAAGAQPGSSPTGAPGEPGAPPTPQPGTQPATPAPAKEPVTIGFLRQTETGENAGFSTPNQGDPNGQIQTLVDWMNANGGLNGHPVEASIRTVDINNTGRPQEEATCRAFTEQDKAFAVVPLALIYAESRACYAEHGTILFDPTPFHMPEPVYDDLAPYIWQTSYPSTSRMIRALADSLEAQGYFEDGMRLGFVAPDAPYFRDSFDADAVPAFAAKGVEFAEVAFIQNDSIPNTQSGLQQAAFRFQTQGITHVVFYGNALLAPLFMTNAESNAYFPRYGITSFDQPKFMADQWSTPQSLEDAVGAGFSAAQDVDDTEVAFPAPHEQRCLDVYAADGHAWETRADAKIALGYCDAAFLMKDAADRLGDATLNAQNLSDAVQSLGTSYTAATSFSSRIVPGRQDITDTYRPMAYDAACDCFQYTAGPTRIPE